MCFLPSIPASHLDLFCEASVGLAGRTYRAVGSDVRDSTFGVAGGSSVDRIQVFVRGGWRERTVAGAEHNGASSNGSSGGGIRDVG